MRKRLLPLFILSNLLISIILAPFVIFYGPFQSLKLLTVGTIMTSRHPQVAEFFLNQSQLEAIMKSYQETIAIEPVIQSKEHLIIDETNRIWVEEIKGKYFKGKVMLVRNPKQVKVAVTSELGIAGQRLSQLVKENQAIAGINGGGFYDPNAQGNGALPDGITFSDGSVVHNRLEQKTVNLIGLDQSGKLILGEMSQQEAVAKGIENAVSFYPNLLIDGEPQIKGDGGWGIAPRTGIGQKSDGTIIFVVIDGRQPGWSMGATLRDLMNVFIEYGAVNAANLDGGSSAEMIYHDRIINRLWNIYGERYIPTGFVVLPANDNGIGEKP